ncbi:MAG: DUF4265 domain-containing protein, partial [Actinomycetota bacterium]|nr:DUF4265 domain-containing protein [Actinomycetota bacterium]
MSTSPVARPGQHPGPDARPTIEVTFQLTPGDGWPPFAAERVAAVLETPDEARIVGTPIFVDDVSVGDTVQVARGAAGFAAGSVLRRGRHSTVRVVAATAAELEALRADLGYLAERVAASAVPPVLAIDVDDRTPIEDLLVRLDWACTSTLTYAISC